MTTVIAQRLARCRPSPPDPVVHERFKVRLPDVPAGHLRSASWAVMVLAGSVLPACVSGTHERGPSAVAPAIATAADECREAGGSVPSIPVLKSPSGSLRLCVPFADVWDMPDLRHPFAVRFTLIRIDDARRNHSVASTNKLTYPLR